MLIRKPSFYDSFRCLAGACPDSCCQDWAVTIDDITREKYIAMSGSLGAALREHLAVEDGETILEVLEDGRCPMWREDGLCRIQAEKGESFLSCVCRQFPRLTHDYGDFQEWGLELSCPKAAEMLLTLPWKWESVEISGSGSSEYDTDTMAILKSTRETIIDLLKDHLYSVPQVLTLALMYGYHVQGILDGGEETDFDPEAALKTASDAAKTCDYAGMLAFFENLEILRNSWRMRLGNPESPGVWDDRIRNLAIYFIDRYYLQAVSDYDLVSRVKFMVIACLLIRHLGGELIQTAQEFSKEIENDAENIDAILDGAYTEAAFADVRLFGCLLEKTGV